MNKYIKTKSYENFTLKVMNIVEHYHFFMQESFKLEDKVNNNVQNSKKDSNIQSTSLSFYSIFNGYREVSTTKIITREERLNNIFYQRNRQIQYFFLEVIELYQKYLVNLYSEILKDKQNFKIEKDLTYKKVLNKIRININDFNKYEIGNQLNINFKLKNLFFIELRNIITHNNGIIQNKEIFIKDIIEKSGYAYDKRNIEIIKSYFVLDKNNNCIMFERIEQKTDLDFKEYNQNEYGKDYIDDMLSYVNMIDILTYSKYSGENKC
jgi:hypothetical protein